MDSERKLRGEGGDWHMGKERGGRGALPSSVMLWLQLQQELCRKRGEGRTGTRRRKNKEG